MPLAFDQLEQRILGTLIEKEMTVPDTYPLTLVSLVSGCNQKSNREPLLTVEPYEVEGALRSLMDRGFVEQMERAGGRTPRYEHRLREQLAVDAADLAILSELLNRGPQAPGELKTRLERMHRFASPAEVEARLLELAKRPVPYVRRLERRPREHAPRWMHLLAKEAPPEPESAGIPEAPPAAAPSVERPFPARSDLIARVESLEEEVSRLRGLVERLTGSA